MQPIHPLLCALLCNNRRSCERCTITFLSRSPLHPTPHQILARVPAFLSLSLFAYYFITLACFRYFFPFFYSHFDDSDFVYVQAQWQEEIKGVTNEKSQ